MSINFILLIFAFNILYSCNSADTKLVGITSRLEEEYFYGENFSVTLKKIDKESLEKIKLELKNSLSLSNENDRIEKWKEISNLRMEDYEYLLFQLIPKTRVIPEFLDFKFSLGDESSIKSYSYYVYSTNVAVRNYSFYGGYPIGGGIIYGAPGYPYYRVHPYETDINITANHSYHFVILFNKNTINGKRQFFATTPSGNKIEFELY